MMKSIQKHNISPLTYNYGVSPCKYIIKCTYALHITLVWSSFYCLPLSPSALHLDLYHVSEY